MAELLSDPRLWLGMIVACALFISFYIAARLAVQDELNAREKHDRR